MSWSAGIIVFTGGSSDTKDIESGFATSILRSEEESVSKSKGSNTGAVGTEGVTGTAGATGIVGFTGLKAMVAPDSTASEEPEEELS